MYCKNCGTFIPDGISFCPSCGTVQDVAPEQKASYPYQQPQQQPQQQYQPPYQQQYQSPYQQYQQQHQPAEGSMPNEGVALVLVILGFLVGVLWGIIELLSYNKMKSAISAGNCSEAQRHAKKIRTVFIIGAVINTLLVIFYISQGSF